MSTVLDWRELVVEPDLHECDCRYCEVAGEEEPREWPLLVVAEVDGVDYVTDRFLMVRGDLAPVPEPYEGTVLPGRPNASSIIAAPSDITDDRPALDQHFRWSTLRALYLTGWDLRVIHGTDKRVAVVDSEGRPIGVAIKTTLECDDERHPDFTRPYSDHVSSSAATSEEDHT